MPGMDGFQALQAIKKTLGTATIPIIMYTSQEVKLSSVRRAPLGAVRRTAETDQQADVYEGPVPAPPGHPIGRPLGQNHVYGRQCAGRERCVVPTSPDLAAIAAAADPNLPVALTRTSLREQFAELRRAT